MPELPEVQHVVNTLQPHITGRRVRGLAIHRPDYLRPAGIDWEDRLVGRRIACVARRAKRIIFRLDNGMGFFIHLGMTGRLSMAATDAPLEPHTHLQINLDDRRVLNVIDPRRFGNVTWLGEASEGASIGPEPLTLRPAELGWRLGRTTRAVKTALLDQRLIAGLGNIYVDESLHRAGIHPLRRCCDLETAAVRRLNRAIKSTLRQAIRAGGSTLRDYVDANGERGGYQRHHLVYGREGKPCRACGARIIRLVLGGRGTHFCASCQPAAPDAMQRGPVSSRGVGEDRPGTSCRSRVRCRR